VNKSIVVTILVDEVPIVDLADLIAEFETAIEEFPFKRISVNIQNEPVTPDRRSLPTR
jgi:hypothetical protein